MTPVELEVGRAHAEPHLLPLAQVDTRGHRGPALVTEEADLAALHAPSSRFISGRPSDLATNVSTGRRHTSSGVLTWTNLPSRRIAMRSPSASASW